MKILIAEDEPALREILSTVLTDKGHEVVITVDGAAALRAYHDADGAFDWLITDYQMPKKNGVVLIMDVRKKNPKQKCLLVSADPPQLSDAVKEDAGEFPMLRKPYSNEELHAILV